MRIKLTSAYLKGKSDKREQIGAGTELEAGKDLPADECKRLVELGHAVELASGGKPDAKKDEAGQ